MNSSSIDHLVVEALGLERIGEAEAADHEVRARGAAAVELAVDVLAFAEQRRPRGSSVELRGQVLAVQVGRADLDRLHRQLARQEAGQRDLELRIREEEDAACRPSWLAVAAPARRARARGRMP